ncbi:MAG: phage baseplate assembly protein V [Desulfovibrio sp.]
MFNLADLEARVARLESRNYVSMRYGRVTGTKDGEAQIQLNDADELNTNSYQTLQRRVLRDQEIKLPDIGDTALVLESGQGEEQGAYLGAPYSQAVPGPGQEQQVAYSKYEDGTELWYDRKAHTLTAKVNGSVKAKGAVSVSSETDIKLKAPFIGLPVL